VNIADLIAARQKPFYSLEFFPPKEKSQWPEFFRAVDKLQAVNPLFASVTYGAGGGTQENTLEITARLKESGLTPMPHLTCVGAERSRIVAFLDQLRELGVGNVMALRGDPPKNSGLDWQNAEFRYASDLVAFVRRQYPDFGIGVAGYTSAHPEAATFRQDRLHTKLKLDAGGDFVVTQLFFDAREYFDMVERLRDMGVEKPVLPGILPIQSLESIRRVLSLCGANIPGNLYLSLEEAHRAGAAAAVKETGIAFAARQIRLLLDGGAPGVHLYTLNRSETCLRLAEAVGPL
jgi:methylenetetrahydrofolate reductase (NADPH)